MLLMRMRLRSDSVQRARETVRLKVRVGVVPSKAPHPRKREKMCGLLQQARLTSKSHPMASCAIRTATGAPRRTAHRQARSRAARIERPPTQTLRAITHPTSTTGVFRRHSPRDFSYTKKTTHDTHTHVEDLLAPPPVIGWRLRHAWSRARRRKNKSFTRGLVWYR